MQTNEQRILNMLGLARRAGKLVTGEELVLNAVRANKTNLVFIASDAGQATAKKVTDKTTFYNVPLVATFTKQALNDATGMARTIYGVSDAGFAKKIKQLINEKGVWSILWLNAFMNLLKNWMFLQRTL